MSFILDALKKSEAERQRQAGPALLEMRIVPPPRGLPTWAIVVGVILLAGVGALGWLALRAKPAPAAASLGVPATVEHAASAAMQPANPASAPNTMPASGADAAAQVASGNGAAQSASPAQVPDATDADQASDNPADNAPAVAPNPRSAATSANGATGSDGAKLRNYAELSGSVPELRLDLHVYAPDPADRFAFINMHKVREGDVTPEGAKVQQITRDGVVLEYRGSEFLLGRQ